MDILTIFAANGYTAWETLLWLIAIVMGVTGLFKLYKGDPFGGIALILLAFLIGPGGVSFLS